MGVVYSKPPFWLTIASPVARHFRRSVTVPSCAYRGPAQLWLSVIRLVESTHAVAMLGNRFPCPCTRLWIHLGAEKNITQCLSLSSVYFKKETFSRKSICALMISQVVITWTNTLVFICRVSTRSDKWFNHSWCSAIDWLRSLLLWT